MTPTPQHLFLILLNEGDLEGIHGFRFYFKKHFHYEEEGVQWIWPALNKLLANRAVIEFDIENDGDLDSVLYDHNEHGQLDYNDFSLIGFDTKYGLGPGAIDFALNYCDELAEQAINGGFENALAILRALPVNSSKWTGAPQGFLLTEEVKLKLLKMLDEAELSLSKSVSSNSDVYQGIAYIRCAKILCDTPEPPKNEIWSLLNKGATIASLVSFFAPIIGLFGKP